MKAAVMTDIGVIEMQERPMPVCGDTDVIVEITDVGVCGSDIHYFEEGKIGEFVVEDDIVLGHESAGIVREVGDSVDGLTTNTKVAIEPGYPCRKCDYCKQGDYHLCIEITFMATPPDDGAFAQYVAWPADFVYPLPQEMSLQEGALCEPLSVGIHACQLGDVSVGDRVLITGAGPIGLLGMETAFAYGANEVYVSDVVQSKLDFADARGATGTIDGRTDALGDAINRLTDSEGVDVVMEASGAPDVYTSVLECVRPGGTIVAVGLPSSAEIPFDFTGLSTREINIQGSFRYNNTYGEAIELISSGTVDVAGIIDREYDFDDITGAMIRAQDHEIVKTMISMNAT
jgi:L-iditol 2-dehydrogenase